MKKCLLLIALLVFSQWNILCAQTLFDAPDTVCVNQPVKLTSKIFNQESYYWGFCSGYLLNAPAATNMGDNFEYNLPANIDIVYDSNAYYGFVVNAGTREFLRLNFGNSLTNTPTVTNFGDLTKGLPENPSSLFIVHDSLNHNWHVFVSGGFVKATSSLARIDFGRHLNNPSPNIANFGNFNDLMDGPKGIVIIQNGIGDWKGFLVNHNDNQLIHLEFGPNLSTTPFPTSMGNIAGSLQTPSDMAGVFGDDGKFYLFVTNAAGSTLTRLSFGNNVDTLTPGGIILGSFIFRIIAPSAISLNKDCGATYFYVTDSTTSQLVGIKATDLAGPAADFYAVDFSVIGGINYPAGISSILRDRDHLYGFVTNAGDSSMTRLDFTPCTSTTIPGFAEVDPPVYEYTQPGEYNVYFTINQGLPTMQVECKLITVLPYPEIFMNNDTTICEGDTIRLHVISNPADSIRWQSAYAIDTTNLWNDSVKVYPHYDTRYPVSIHYPFGCIVDTVVDVHVVRVHADAGPDRWILDGASTIIGGPGTSGDDQFNDHDYQYSWYPYQFLSDSLARNPVATPPYDFTYYLTVRDTTNGSIGCVAKDTMVVHVQCGDFYLPNAFAPNSTSSAINRFGIINKGLSSLSYFRVFNRWGVLVFESTDPSEGWDGTYNGKLAPEGVYVWQAEGFCYSGLKLKKQGNVTLLR